MADPDILLGPILGIEWDEPAAQTYYTVIVRVRGSNNGGNAAPVWVVDGEPVAMELLRALHDGSSVWRGEIALNPFDLAQRIGRTIGYRIECAGTPLANLCGDDQWAFHLPGRLTPDQQPRVAFCSCNGFTDATGLNGREPLYLWQHMQALHGQDPFSLLIMGGDQIYCDDLARQKGALAQLWAWASPAERAKLKPRPEQLLKDYFDHYLVGWVRVEAGRRKVPHTAMVRMMASIPSVMMWDDHDIFDGWGSYQADPKSMPYHVEAYAAARAAFEVYQIRGAAQNRSLLDRGESPPRHYTQGLRFGPLEILALDNRSQRTPHQIMDEEEWGHVIAWLRRHAADTHAGARSLLVVAPVPVVYRRFADWVSETPGEHGGEDDLRDHWNHRNHQGERNRLVAHLFDALRVEGADKPSGFARVTLLSGDVHVGAMGFLERTDGSAAEIAQVISSAIVHPEPGAIAWAGVRAISSETDYHIQGQPVLAKMAPPVGAGSGEAKYLRCRNFVWVRPGNDGKLWVNWECEEGQGRGQTQTRPRRVEFGLR